MNTLRAACRFEQEIRRSRFVAHCAPVSSQADTLAFYESVADAQANHNCWAWRLDGVVRFNDDGEPAGSAGRPILAAIEGRELDRTMIVVTRYFGGIKLGIGGLVRAYGGVASRCLDRASIVRQVPHRRGMMEIDFSLVDTALRTLDELGAQRESERYTDRGMEIRFRLPERHTESLERAMANASRGAARVRFSDEVFPA